VGIRLEWKHFGLLFGELNQYGLEMTIPDYQTLMLPVLKHAATGEIRIGDIIDKLAVEFNMSDEELGELIPSGKQPVFYNRVHWARQYLKQAGLVEATKRAHIAITTRGKNVLASGVQKIDIRYLKQFPEFFRFPEPNKFRCGIWR
jgi:restriction system protein